VGDDSAVLELAGPDTVRADLQGRTVMPGLIDAHAHMDREGLRRIYPSLADARSIADVQAIVRQAAAAAPPGGWVGLMPPGEPPQPGPARRGAPPTATISTRPRRTTRCTSGTLGLLARSATVRRRRQQPGAAAGRGRSRHAAAVQHGGDRARCRRRAHRAPPGD